MTNPTLPQTQPLSQNPTKSQAARRKPRRPLLFALGVLGGIAVTAVAGIAGLFVVATSAIRSSDAYRTSLELVQSSPIAQRELGHPIEDGFMPTGSVERTGDFGRSQLSISLEGPRGKGTAHVVAHRDGTRWVVEGAQLEAGSSLFQLAP